MKHVIALVLGLTLAGGAVAQDSAPVPAPPVDSPPASDTREGLSLMERGAEMFFRGILGELEPQIDEFRNFAQEAEPLMQEFADHMGPALVDLLAKIDDLSNYEAPEILPNGDIIIRRSPDAPVLTDPRGEVEL